MDHRKDSLPETHSVQEVRFSVDHRKDKEIHCVKEVIFSVWTTGKINGLTGVQIFSPPKPGVSQKSHG